MVELNISKTIDRIRLQRVNIENRRILVVPYRKLWKSVGPFLRNGQVF